MFKAFVLVCTMMGDQQCTELHNPNLFNRTEEDCVRESLEFIEHLQNNTPYPILVSYRCEYYPGV